MNSDSIKQLWQSTLGADPGDGWATLSGGATYRAAEEVGGTLSGGSTVGGTLSGAATVSGTLSGGTTVGGAEGISTSRIGLGGFHLIEEIGRGGMGVVWRARQDSLARDVAVKLIRSEASNERSRRGFVSEALVNGVLDHPNIVPVHELGTTPEGEAFLAMKLVGGTAWNHLLHPRNAVEQERAKGYDTDRHLGVLEAVANAVAFAHSRGIVHRDLKPENVMVGEYGEVLVMDWGIAVDIRERPDPTDSRATHKSDVRSPAGTPNYMAPELAEGRGGDIGPWTDVYLLGAILCEILRGTPPHQGNSLMAILLAASRSDAPAFPAGTPAGLITICHKALSRDHRARHASVPALQAALAEYRKHRESDVVASAAQGALDRCASRDAAKLSGAERAALYGDYAEAVAGFRQALSLWSENASAKQGEAAARRGYATAALAAGDLALAEAQAAPLQDSDLNSRISAATRARQARESAAKRNRFLLIGSAAVIVIGLTVGVLMVNAQRSRAVNAEQEAVTQRDVAVAAEQEAQKRRVEAERADWKSRNLAAASIAKEQSPLPQAEAAMALAVAREVHPDTAPTDALAGNGVAHDAWLRFAYAQRPPTVMRWSVDRGQPLHDVIETPSGIVVIPEKGSLVVLSRADGSVLHTLADVDGNEFGTDRALLLASGDFVSVHWNGRLRAWSVAEGTKVIDFEKFSLDSGFAAVTATGDGIVHADYHKLRLLTKDGSLVSEVDLIEAFKQHPDLSWQDGQWNLSPRVIHIIKGGTYESPVRVLYGAYNSSGSIWEAATPIESPYYIEWSFDKVPLVEPMENWQEAYKHGGFRIPAWGDRPLLVQGVELRARDGLMVNWIDQAWQVPLASTAVAWDRFDNDLVIAQSDNRISLWQAEKPKVSSEPLSHQGSNLGKVQKLSQDERYAMVLAYDHNPDAAEYPPFLKSYSLHEKRQTQTLGLGNVLIQGAIASDGSWLAAITAEKLLTKADRETAGFDASESNYVVYAIGDKDPVKLDLPTDAEPLWIQSGVNGDFLLGTVVGVLHFVRAGDGFKSANDPILGNSQIGAWSADGSRFSVLMADNVVIVFAADGARELFRLPDAARRLSLAWGESDSLLVTEKGGWLATYDAKGKPQARIRIPDEVLTPRYITEERTDITAHRKGALITGNGYLVNPRDGMILRHLPEGVLMNDGVTVLRFEPGDENDPNSSAALVHESLLPVGVSFNLPALRGNEAAWDQMMKGLDYRLAIEGAYAGEAVPTNLVP